MTGPSGDWGAGAGGPEGSGGRGPDDPEERLRELQARRAAARSRTTQRAGRRRLAVAGLVAGALAVVGAGAVVGAQLGKDDDAPKTQQTAGGASSPAQADGGAGTGGAAATTPKAPTTPRATPATSTDPTAAREPESWPQTGAAAQRTKVPIFMYHLIAAAPAGTAYPDLWVPPEELKAQVSALDEAGYVGVTLDEVWDAWHGDGRLPKKPVVLSFDDGSYSQVLSAGPILKDAGWPGVLNLTTDHVGKDGIPSWGVKRLIKLGWTVDSHTITHPDVTSLDAAALARELSGSKAQIKAKFGVTPKFFCYPAGRNDATSRAAVEEAGYLGATTTEPGIAARADDPFALPRIRVDPALSGAAIVKLASGESTVAAGGGE